MGFRTGVRFSSGPLENGIVCCESDLQCRYFYVKIGYKIGKTELGGDEIMRDYAVLTSNGNFTIFEYDNEKIRFATSKRLEKYTKVVEWDHGYLVVMAKYQGLDEVEEYIDLIPILENLYYDVDNFLKPIKEVRIEYAA